MGIFGGKLGELPRPIRRKFGKRSAGRVVRVTLTTWRGFSLGAKHWYAKLEEEDNPVWNRKEKTWQLCWDDRSGKGRVVESRDFADADVIRTRKQALVAAQRMAGECFGDGRHLFVLADGLVDGVDAMSLTAFCALLPSELKDAT